MNENTSNNRLLVKSPVLPRFLSAAVVLYLLSFIFEGVVRFSLSSIGLASLLYLRDIIPLLVILFLFSYWFKEKLESMVFIFFFIILMIHFSIGFSYLGGLFQQLFGFKVFMPLLMGVALANYWSPQVLIKSKNLVTLVFFVTLLGVFLNHQVVFPWEGEDFSTVFGVSEQSRNWTASGVRRLAGFSRASFDAASVILISTLFVLFRWDNFIIRLSIFILSFFAVFLTTSKGALLALIVLALVFFLSNNGKRVMLIKIAFFFVVSLVSLVPLISLLFDVNARNVSPEVYWWISSFIERMEWMWPRAFEMWLQDGNIVFGRGLGGIGVAQGYGEWYWINAGDNIFVYWLVTFGLLGVVYLLFFAYHFSLYKEIDSSTGLLVMAGIIAILTYGLTANCIEQPILSIALGYFCATILGARKTGEMPK